DRRRIRRMYAVEHLRVERSPKLLPANASVVEERGVDADHDNVLGRGLLAADREVRVDPLTLETLEEAELEHERDQHQARDAATDGQKQPRPQVLSPLVHPASLAIL